MYKNIYMDNYINIDYNSKKQIIRISYFIDNHFQDEIFVDLNQYIKILKEMIKSENE